MKNHLSRIVICVFIILMFTVFVSAQEVEEYELTLDYIYDNRTGFYERKGTYTGTLENGLPNGKGKFESVNSEGIAWYYEGYFVNGRFQGEGKTYWENGRIEEGFFENGVLYNGKRYSNGSWQTIIEGRIQRKMDYDAIIWPLVYMIISIAIVMVLVFLISKYVRKLPHVSAHNES